MKLKDFGTNLQTPKNFSRKGNICSCLCRVLLLGTSDFDAIYLNNIQIKYEIIPNKKRKNNFWRNTKFGRDQWSTYYGEFSKIIELPPIFSELDEEDYTIVIGSFKRDQIQMPFVHSVEIENVKKYQILKTKEDRRNKLNKLKNKIDDK